MVWLRVTRFWCYTVALSVTFLVAGGLTGFVPFFAFSLVIGCCAAFFVGA